MKYFIDTEFIEGFHKPLFGKRRHFIDLISIGIVCEDGREYYAISKEFNSKDADEWVKQNVISKLPERYVCFNSSSPNEKRKAMLWKGNKQIANDIYNFVNPDLGFHVSAYNNSELRDGGKLKVHFDAHNVIDHDQYFVAQPEFYGYYADYDWVLFCSLFGRMIDLPKGFPMYCRDLKQMMDDAHLTKEWKHEVCPDPEGEHDALVDARWNMNLYNKIIAEVSNPSIQKQ